NLEDLKVGKQVEVPIYEFDFKSSSRVGYSEKLRPLLDLRVSVTGQFTLILLNLVYTMYKAFIEPGFSGLLKSKYPFTGFQSPTYILKV
ncbi:hypothetical protein HID58_034807, partial [Brassica napus]